MSKAEKTKWSNPASAIHHAIALWAADCAEHTLHLFEENSPEDTRPRLAIEALRLWVNGEKKMVECREAAFAAHAAAREAQDPAGIAAARACGQAVAVAHMYNHAPHAASYAAKAASLAVSKEQAAQAFSTERDWQWNHLNEDLRAICFPKGK